MNVSNIEVHTDPVCRMQVDEKFGVRFIHRGITHWFCSTQCLESFQENPDLYAGLHHIQNAPPVIKSRRVAITSEYEGAQEIFMNIVGHDMGVINCGLDGVYLCVEYDLRQLTWKQVEHQALLAGIEFPGVLSAIRRGIWRFTERNELKNLAHWFDASCCNHPPRGAK